MTVTLAFYKGTARRLCHRAVDTAIRLRTLSKYSHVELIPDPVEIGQPARVLSSSPRDGGVRETAIMLKPGQWDLVELKTPADPPVSRIREVYGAPYDFKGILFSQALPLGIHQKEAWFCSELVAYALLIGNANQLSPGMLFDLCPALPQYQRTVIG